MGDSPKKNADEDFQPDIGKVIVGSDRRVLSPWVTLVENSVRDSTGRTEVYCSLQQADYVSILAISTDGLVPLVEQFRPATGGVTLELPGGLVDPLESPGATAQRELFEETGATGGDWCYLGGMWPDTGRLQNRLWAYFVNSVQVEPNAAVEEGLRCRWFSRQELKNAIEDGRFDHALHVAIVGLAYMHGLFDWAVDAKIHK
jgi:ADP-ribose pyrophosphatase